MNRIPEILFLPGFDGNAALREPFVAALGEHHPARAVSYPADQTLGSLRGYVRYAAAQASENRRHILVAESFSGLVAAQWAAVDPHVEAVVLCASFARNPVRWLASVGAALPEIVRLGALAVIGPQPGEAGCGPELPPIGVLLARNLERLDQVGFTLLLAAGLH